MNVCKAIAQVKTLGCLDHIIGCSEEVKLFLRLSSPNHSHQATVNLGSCTRVQEMKDEEQI